MPVNYVFEDDVEVEVAEVLANDGMVVATARVSTIGKNSFVPEDPSEHFGLINFLMKNRHGSPFEHNMFMFRVRAPIVVWREHMRHRIGFSYNEESGRYRQLEPCFYLPGLDRMLIQVGKPGEYSFVKSDREDLIKEVRRQIEERSVEAYEAYEAILAMNVAKEVARLVLPVNIFSTVYVTCNARSLMHFLSLRTIGGDEAKFPSFPMREIEMVAEEYEKIFEAYMPLTYRAFCENGRVAP